MRLTVNDERGIIARVADTLAREGMNIDSVQQEPHSPKERLSLFFTVEPVSEPKVRGAIEKINDFHFTVEPRAAVADRIGFSRAARSLRSTSH